VDGVRFEQIEEQGRERWLGNLREDLRSGNYRPARAVSEILCKCGLADAF